jgi:hypothetical protein
MPIEREFSTILAMPDEGLFRWRGDTRKVFAGQRGARLSAPWEASGQEIVHRAGRAWLAGHDQ